VAALLPLPASKLAIPPARPQLVSRPRLYPRLDAGLGEACPLTLLSAPAGFGKTTLVTQWIRDQERQAAWLSLDDEDNDAHRFLGSLAGALRRLSAGDLREAGQPAPQSPPRAVVTLLVNSLAEVAAPSVLVLDDYHVITASEIHEAVAFLVEHLPPRVHLLILTRSDPPLPLARLRARGQLAEVRAVDLRFTADEAAAFLTGVMRLPLSGEAVERLERRTEGWIAGLQLAALSMQGRNELDAFVAEFSGSHHFILDYLTEEVLNRQPAEVCDFLLKTSVLDRLSGPLCDALLKDEGGRMKDEAGSEHFILHNSSFILSELERANVFIVALDDERRWYRYHALFADLLRSRLQRERPEMLPELHRRACRWLAQSGDAEEAMKHALAVPDLPLAADLAEAYLLPLIHASRIATALQWIRHLPEALIASRAYLCASCGWVYAINGQVAEAEQIVQAGEAALAQFEPVYSPAEQRTIARAEVGGHLAAVAAYCARQREDAPRAIALSEKALHDLPASVHAVRSLVALNLALLHLEAGHYEQSRRACLEALNFAQRPPGNLYVAVTALSMLGASAIYQGQLSTAADFCHRAIELGAAKAGGGAPVQAIGYAHGWLASVHAQRSELAAAEKHLDQAAELVELIGPQESIVYSHLYRARLAIDGGDAAQAEASLRRGEALMQAQPVGGNVTLEWISNRARLLLARGEAAAAGDWLAEQAVREADLAEAARGEEQRQAVRLRLPAYLLLARVRLAQGKADRAAELLESIRAMAEADHNTEVLLEALAFQALAAERKGDRTQALRHVNRALMLAAPESWKRPILNAGKALVPLLRQAAAHGVLAPFALSLIGDLAGSDELRRASPSALSPETAGLVEPLTEREVEVLRLVADGLSNQEIAGRLVITVGTVKAHTSNLYGKLTVSTRTQAVARARALGLL
jgi:LuxR family maltose regulon positive regulatory protein